MREETLARLWAALKTRPFHTVQVPLERVHVYVQVLSQKPVRWISLEPT